MLALESLTDESFLPFVGEAFTVTTHSGEFELRLKSVKKLGHRSADATRDPFSLVFCGAPELLVAQGIHRFSYSGFGELELFITQIAGGVRDSEFEAIFT